MAQRRADAIVDHLKAASGFRYTLDGGDVVSQSDREFYEENGFLVVRGLISPEDCELFKQRFVDVTEKRSPPSPMTVFMRDVSLKTKRGVAGESTTTKLYDWVDDDVFMKYCRDPNILKYIESFTGPDIRVIHTMLINKPPDLGTKSSRHPLHQDLYYFPFRPADRIACSWTALQHIDRENGCLVVSPGTHRRAPGGVLRAHGYPKWQDVNAAYHGIEDIKPDEVNLVHLTMEAGDTVFFHPLLIHGSGSNRTSGFRKSISGHFASASDCELHDCSGTVQDPIVKEVEAMAKLKIGASISFNDYWRYSSRVVKGTDKLGLGLGFS